MKKALLVLLLVASCYAQGQSSQALLSTRVLVDATYTTYTDGSVVIPVKDLLFAGVIVHASAANATITVTDGSTVIFEWKEPTDAKSSGEIIPVGGIPYTTNLIVDCTNCTATLFRRRR